MSAVLQRRQRFDPQLPKLCLKTSFYRGLQTVIATLPFMHMAFYLQTKPLMPIRSLFHKQSSDNAAEVEAGTGTNGWSARWLLCLTYCLAWVFCLRGANSTHYHLSQQCWLTMSETKKENKGTCWPIVSDVAEILTPNPELGLRTTWLGPTASLGILYATFCQCFLCPAPSVNGLF